MTDTALSSPSKIAVVDDSRSIISYLTDVLSQKGYIAQPFLDSEEALKALPKDIPHLILMDINMPKLNGFELCSRLKLLPAFVNVPIIFVSTERDYQGKVKAFQMGGQDYLTKPFEVDELYARINTHLRLSVLQKKQIEVNQHLERLVAEQVTEISIAQLGTIKALAKLAEYRDEDTGAHLFRVAEYCKVLGYGLISQHQPGITSEFVEMVSSASPLHDIGKVAIPDNILLKPGKLTEQEFEIMKTHASIGARTLKTVMETNSHNRYLSIGADIALSHHEKWNGTGYPFRLKETEIPLCGRIMAVADVYDALRSKRCYKSAFNHERASEIIIGDAGTHFDPVLVDVFKRKADQFKTIFNQYTD